MANNKARLDNHNDIIEAIINTASSLPPYEDVGPETAEYTNLLTEALTEISGKAYYPGQDKTVTAGTENITVVPDEWHTLASVTVQPTPSQSKEVTAGTSAATITPDEGYLMNSVVVNPTPSETKTVTAGTSQTSVVPDEGYLMDSVVVNPTPSESKTVTPVPEGMIITPDTGKLLSRVILNGFDLPKPEGQYVWEKYNPRKTVTVNFEVTSKNPMKLRASCADVDLTKVTGNFFAGMKGTYISLNSTYEYEFISGSIISVNYNQNNFAYDPTTCTIAVNVNNNYLTSWGSSTTEVEPMFTGDYIVSDSSNEYPDGGLHTDGYWYKKASIGVSPEMFGYTKMAVDTFMFSARTAVSGTTLNHSLADIPKIVMISTKATATDYGDATNMLSLLHSNTGMINGALNYYYTNMATATLSGTVTGTTVKLTLTVNPSYIAGVEYTLITMA